MILKEEEYYKFMEAFRKRALKAGIKGGAINRIIASIPQASEYDLSAIYRTLIMKAVSLGVDEDLFTTILAEATNDRENELYGTGVVEKHQEVYGVAPVRGPIEVVEKHQEVYGVAPIVGPIEVVEKHQEVYGVAPIVRPVEVVERHQEVYGVAPIVGPIEVIERHQEVYGVAPVEERVVVSPQLVYGTPTVKKYPVEEFTEIQAVYGPAQPTRRK